MKRSYVLGFVNIHSFIQTISIVPLQVHCYSEALLTQHGYCVGVSTPKCHRQLRIKDLPKVPTWRLERDSNPQPFGRKASNLPTRHHVPNMLTRHLTFCRISYSVTLVK